MDAKVRAALRCCNEQAQGFGKSKTRTEKQTFLSNAIQLITKKFKFEFSSLSIRLTLSLMRKWSICKFSFQYQCDDETYTDVENQEEISLFFFHFVV